MKIVKPHEVVNSIFGPELFRIKGGRAKYDEVYMADGGSSVYLVRIGNDLHVTKRKISWDTAIEQLYEI